MVIGDKGTERKQKQQKQLKTSENSYLHQPNHVLMPDPVENPQLSFHVLLAVLNLSQPTVFDDLDRTSYQRRFIDDFLKNGHLCAGR